eukprot:TRINITY_DN2268_c0_g1_i1.p1 TRINITY_DN2268_c0_g1~~TRINITY_DN2268_c0_g1_i1.p1  ORF type:complete len:392 (-),score=21.50 TRINITY_DN2268_c0_g1_i1:31-1206(-)
MDKRCFLAVLLCSLLIPLVILYPHLIASLTSKKSMVPPSHTVTQSNATTTAANATHPLAPVTPVPRAPSECDALYAVNATAPRRGFRDLARAQNEAQGLVGSAGWTKTKQLLEYAKANGAIVYMGSIFSPCGDMITEWLKACGIKAEHRPNDKPTPAMKQLAVMVGIEAPQQLPQHSILIQSEQMLSPWASAVHGFSSRCGNAQNCAIWEFSEINRRLYASNGYPAIILPVMLRLNDKSGYANPTPLKPRPFNYVFHGIGNGRREILNRLGKRWTAGDRVGSFQQSKLCVSVHYYHADSGIEYHRMGEHGPYGCMPLYETPGDAVVAQFLAQQGAVLFAPHGSIVQIANTILACIDKEPELMREKQMHIHNWWSQELDKNKSILKELFEVK